LARLNEGNAFDLSSGIFTVPGIYHFDLSAMKDSTYFGILLQVNGNNVGNAGSRQFGEGNWDVVSLSATLRLAPGDKVNVFLLIGKLMDSFHHHTHFTGWLVEEDLM